MVYAIYNTSNISKNIKKNLIVTIGVFLANIILAIGEIIAVNYMLNPVGPFVLLIVNFLFGYQSVLGVEFENS
ncbi:MAG: hypothetical protein CMF62_01015 [Magnetococcales bacterium]|nr:hypothetical protein [Magnetococcales bacterium]|tara:strand:- start:37203 stop:37421 length:219 start_codon:yes stop_codon:yes gene_type:complete